MAVSRGSVLSPVGPGGGGGGGWSVGNPSLLTKTVLAVPCFDLYPRVELCAKRTLLVVNLPVLFAPRLVAVVERFEQHRGGGVYDTTLFYERSEHVLLGAIVLR